MKTILFVGAGPAQVTGIILAKEMGHRVIAVDGNAEALGLSLADIGIPLDIKDISSVLRVAIENGVDGVLSVASDICLVTVSVINKALGLPGITPEQILVTTNKGEMKKRLSEHAVPGPDFFIIDNADRICDAMEFIGLPAVVKPVDSAGSRGVSYIDSSDELEEKYQEAVRFSMSRTAILERFVPGPEVSVEAFVWRGKVHILTLSDKDGTPPPHLLDVAVKFPTALPETTQKEVCDLALRAITALSLNNCPIHMEIILTEDGPRVVEVAARGPGFRVYTDILPHVTGVSGVRAQIQLLFGKAPELTPNNPLKGACIMFFGSEKTGTVKDIWIQGNLRNDPGVFDLNIYVKPGQRVRKLSCGNDRIGHVITLSDTREEAVSLSKALFRNIQIEVE